MASAKHLQIFIGEDERYGRRPLFEVIVLAAREYGLAGATVFKGFMGYTPRGQIATARILRLANNLPLVVDIVDTEERIDGFMPFLQRVVERGTVVCSDVEAECIIPEESAE